ncbi:MAG: D-alanyl-D-alanine carboxypeptidase/D-alanyl-D-alanine-endopeptidase [Gemmatimonas sp.]|nr:D-alanyl-D-alanine carboxypeptidase/D-alanyl-D-alanine-endopeptidase [Gemmatimonas sp.]
MSPKHIGSSFLGAAVLLGVAAAQVPPEAPPIAASAPVSAAADAPERRPVSPEVADLRDDVDRIVRGSGWPGASSSLLVVSLDRGDTLYSVNPDLPVAPASNMKLYSTAAALYYLGPNFRYSTFALADGEIVDGAIVGDLVLYGTGDPAISSRMLDGALNPLRALADSLVAQGITEVHGDVVGDGSYFDDSWIADGWREEYRLSSYSAPIGALSLAENIVGIRVTPGPAGEPAQIRTIPETDGLLIQNNVRTVGSGRSSIRFEYDPQGLVIEGQIARGHPGVARTVTVVDPANFAAAAFRAVLEEAGVRVHGNVRTIRNPATSPIGRGARGQAREGETAAVPRVLGTHLSPTLAEVATVTNHISQNLFAEAMFKTVGRVALGEGSFEGGAKAVQYFLECERPVDFSGVRFVDGSGLSPLNRVTARSTIHLLDLMTRTDVWEPFFHSLPLAASPNGDHSLRSRMGGTAAARNLRAKTGTISNVSSLSGYVRAANGEFLAFSIIGNEVPSTWQAKRVEDQIGARLARFDRPLEPAAAEVTVVEESRATNEPAATEETVQGSIAPGEPTGQDQAEPEEPTARTHRVNRGDTLDAIARRYGTTVEELERLNPDVQPRRLLLGQLIKVPG